ncbi:GYDIA family GHMP kinase [Bacteroidetes bacterium endosymbiont of Geopemphigus sp.]|uniref:GYDIA family GHMP kinase n=1 Tax=Bacteroidetes bacterium endosymbiont of Geopemphigus sp. TaxID=2047937 RepID=UPI000CD11BDB|nr:GYDIA family GHMP kinase [Bacteroidetes bacterium endosymbiont of Geopemphigus sp.]
MKKQFYSHGKIILSGEYAVLDGAWAIALATRKGQSMEVEKTNNRHHLHWKSYDEHGEIWFESIFSSPSLEILCSTDLQIAEILKQLLLQMQRCNKNISLKWTGTLVKTYLEFPASWGLGSSATLLSNLSQWLEIDPYKLSDKSFGGSGCDISCSLLGQSILYRLQSSKRYIKPIRFEPSFSEELFFLHLNKKKNTRSAISNYTSKKKHIEAIRRLSDISLAIVHCQDFDKFKKLVNEHEQIIAKILSVSPLKKSLFKDYPDTIKSLGAWGGDFALITRTENMESYFKSRGYCTLIPFKEFILNEK